MRRVSAPRCDGKGRGQTAVILCEHGPGGVAALFAGAVQVVQAERLDEVAPALAALDAARSQGRWVAGWIGYEAGLAFEPRLAALVKPAPGPLLAFGIFDGPQAAGPLLAEAASGAAAVRLDLAEPVVSRPAYEAAFDRVQAYIAAGDCYQINLTFPLRTRLRAGTPLGLYGALRRRQAVGYGAYADLGGPVVISRSPELFLRLDAGGRIEARPMKGTAPRDPDPVRDAELASELRASGKAQAENLMIVDLLRNDIARIARMGSVRVPELYAVDSFATLHQMSSRVVGQLAQPASLGGIMAALFPCGSITGAPKIRAIEIIAEVEDAARGVYCGAIGWMAPDGAACFSVAIRTLSVRGTEITLNVGGGVVHDSTAQGEWEEALWKARYITGLTRD